jgi:hypothetical protein
MRLLAILALFPLAAPAQQMVSMQTSGETAIITVRVRETTFTTFSGAPYSAKRVWVATDVRADGTRVPQNRSALFYRDAAGRNRTEAQVAFRDSPYMTTIMDPILGCEYVLDPGNKIAHRLVGVHIGTMPVPQSGSQSRDSEELQPATVPPNAIAVHTIAVHTEDLGTRTMQGLSARGTKTTTSWPPGTRQNNDHTIVTETETWVAASLGNVSVSERTVTPDYPDSSYTLENVVVGEPKAELFMPPPDYRIVEETSDFKIVVARTPTSPAKLAPHGVTAATIPNAPFSGTRIATGAQILADGTRIERPSQTTFSAWRDSQGRVRTEWPPRGNAPGGVEIKDPTTGFVYNLDYLNHIAYRAALSSLPPASAPKPPDPGFEVAVAQVGSQVISGVPADGVRTTMTPQKTGLQLRTIELWTARNEGVVMIEKNNTANEADVVTLKNFTTREPDPSLFRVPATYQILDEYGNQIQAKQ